MKRTAAAFLLAAGVVGVTGCMSTPKAETKTAMSKGSEAKTTSRPSEIQQAQGFRPAGQANSSEVVNAAAYGVNKVGGPTMMDPNLRRTSGGLGSDKYPPQVFGPTQRGIGTALGHGGITPVPSMGPNGAVAMIPGAMMGAGGPGMGSMFANGRTSVRFVQPAGMKIAFQTGNGFGDAGREAPVRYNFVQGSIYRVRINGIPNRPGKNYYPTIEVYGATPDTMTFLAHSTVPVGFTDEDFEQVNAGNMVVKVIYLPSSTFQDVAAAEELVSTKLEPGVNPVEEAQRRGTILAVVRLGNVDLEDPTTPAMDAPAGGGRPMLNPGVPLNPPAPLPPVEPKKADALTLPSTTKTIKSDVPGVSIPKVK
jgi:hypothetical protein